MPLVKQGGQEDLKPAEEVIAAQGDNTFAKNLLQSKLLNIMRDSQSH